MHKLNELNSNTINYDCYQIKMTDELIIKKEDLTFYNNYMFNGKPNPAHMVL